jgi:hypothetical protein
MTLDEEENDNFQEILHREDKIFNNKYLSGDGLTDTEDYEFSKKISVSTDYSDNYLKDLYDYEDELESKFILDSIFSFIQSNTKTSHILRSKSNELDEEGRIVITSKSKFSKDELNTIFNEIYDNLDLKDKKLIFFSPIYIIEVIAHISKLEYKKIFDSLDTEIQSILISELNKKYKFL